MTKTLTGEMRTETATVEAIETSTREVTLKKSDGTYTVARVGKEIKRFDTLKIGDKITARYYDNIVLRLKAPGEKDVDSKSAAMTRAAEGQAAGTVGAQRTITATITAIDQAVPSITFTGPEQLEVQLARRRQGSAREGEGRRQGRHHVDRRDDPVARRSVTVRRRFRAQRPERNTR